MKDKLMNETYRIIDANLNRVSEGLRIIEEIARFNLNNNILTDKLKTLRHQIVSCYINDYTNLLKYRDSQGDIGPQIHNPSTRKNLVDIFIANFKRIQQALRVLEEYSKGDNSQNSKVFELLRYETYTLEKDMHAEILKKYNKQRLNNSLLYLVTDRTQFDNRDDFFNAIASAIKGGVDIVQLREKNYSTKEFIQLAQIIRDICSLKETIFIINDRIDIAMAVKADGVHLGQDDLDIKTARLILGDQYIIGLSTHNPEQAKEAINNGADYIGVGPVFTTPTKPGKSSVGYEYVKWASNNVSIPFYAIGGINLENIENLIETGATRIAAVRSIINANNPEMVASQMLNILQKERTK